MRNMKSSVSMSALVLLVIFLLFTETSYAEFSGFITRDTTFTITNSPYSVDGDIFIPAGITVTIKPGVTFQFKATSDILQGGDYSTKSEIIIYGTLIAEGKPDSMITFKSYAGSNLTGEWGQIKTDLTGSLFCNFINIKNATRGLYFYKSAPYNRLILTHSDFQYVTEEAIKIESANINKQLISANTFSNVGKAVYSNRPSAVFSHNTVSNSTNGTDLSSNSIIFANSMNTLSGWGISTTGNSVVNENILLDIASNGVGLNGNSSQVISNHFTRVRGVSIGMSGSSDLIIGNKIKGVDTVTGTGIQVGYYSFVYNNLTYNVSDGISGCNNPYSARMFTFINYNTITNCQRGIIENNSHYDATTNSKNNIVVNNSSVGCYHRFPSINRVLNTDYDDVWGNNPNYSGVTAGIHGISVNPFFTDPVSEDFTLQEGSPCLTMGENGGQMGAYGGYRQYNHHPVLSLLNFSGNLIADESLEIKWTASDPDTDDVFIYLFWDTDTDTASMTAIDLNLSNTGSYLWDTSRMLPGQYYIRAMAFDYKLGRASVYSAGKVIILHNTSTPSTPTDLVATPGNQSASLSWVAPVTGIVDHYVVYQSTISGFFPSPSDSIGKSTSMTFNSIGLTNGASYHYRVAARLTNGTLTGLSNQASCVPQPLNIRVMTKSSAPGAEISIPVSISDVTGLGVVSYQFKIKFDKTFLTYSSLNTTTCITTGWPTPTSTSTDSSVTVWHAGSTPLTGSGNLINLNFSVKSTATPGDTSVIRIQDVYVNEGSPKFNTFNGWYAVYPAFTVYGLSRYFRDNHPLEGVEISLTGAASKKAMTDNSGNYTIPLVQGGWNYQIAAADTGILAQAISAYDASLILRHIALLDTLDSDQLIAADVSGDGNVTALDATNICQWGVGLIKKFPSSKSWYFTPQNIKIEPLSHDSTVNFYGIAYGDVSGNYRCTKDQESLERFPQVPIRTNYVESRADYEIYLSDKRLTSYNGEKAIQYDVCANTTKGILSFVLWFDLTGGDKEQIEFVPSADFEHHLNVHNLINGKLIIASAGAVPANEGTKIGTLYLKQSVQFDWSELELFRSEINDISTDYLSPTGSSLDGSIIPTTFQLYQNHPNPFNMTTKIKVDLPKETNLRIIIYDLNGRAVNRLCYDKRLNPGTYTFEWNGKDDMGKILPSGVYLCSLSSRAFNSTIKLVYVK